LIGAYLPSRKGASQISFPYALMAWALWWATLDYEISLHLFLNIVLTFAQLHALLGATIFSIVNSLYHVAWLLAPLWICVLLPEDRLSVSPFDIQSFFILSC
jgi:hypothetical protein